VPVATGPARYARGVVFVKLYAAAAPPPGGQAGADAPLLPEDVWRKLDPAHRPSSYVDAVGVTRWVPFNGLGLGAMEIFKLIPTAGAKETALYFKKQSSLSRSQAEAAMLTALAGDFDEYSRVSIYDPTDLERWWRETVLTPEGHQALSAFRREYDKHRLFG
jgi:hypothetical protein